MAIKIPQQTLDEKFAKCWGKSLRAVRNDAAMSRHTGLLDDSGKLRNFFYIGNAMKWDDVTDDDLENTLVDVKYGHDPIAARNLIEYFYERMSDGRSYNQHVLNEFISFAFTRIVEKKFTADQAFGLKLQRGGYVRQDTSERDITCVAYVILLMRHGWTWLDAVGEAANQFFTDDKGDSAVKTAYTIYKNELGDYTDTSLLGMLPEGTPVISRDKTG